MTAKGRLLMLIMLTFALGICIETVLPKATAQDISWMFNETTATCGSITCRKFEAYRWIQRIFRRYCGC